MVVVGGCKQVLSGLSSSPLLVTITPLASSSSVSPSSKLELQAQVTDPDYYYHHAAGGSSSSLLSATWSCSALTNGSGHSTLAALAASPVHWSARLPSPVLLSTLVLPSSALAPGTTYTFKLKAYSSSGGSSSAEASISLTTASLPVSGSLTVSPAVGGVALTTGFSLLARYWTDESSAYPLAYSFSAALSSSSGGVALPDALPLRAASPLPLAEGVLLPPGHNLTVVVVVTNQFNGSGSASASVRVEAPASLSAALIVQVQETVQQALQDYDTDKAGPTDRPTGRHHEPLHRSPRHHMPPPPC